MDTRIKQYMNLRNISDEVLKRRDIRFENGKIVIPVHDSKGKFSFNKYRKDPEDTSDSPKYTYDFGAKATIYKSEIIPLYEEIIFCEGEADSLCLESFSIPAITGTGGCKTFNAEWVDLLRGKTIYICMDNDKAGIEASIKINQMLPDALVMELPKNFDIKDVTDFFQVYKINEWNELKKKAVSYFVPDSKVSEELYKWTLARRESLNKERDVTRENIMIEYLVAREEGLKKPKIEKTENNGEDSRLLQAKKIPLHTIVNFNRKGFAECIYHEERTPSMKYYPKENRFYCFSCGKGGDSIDAYMQINNCDIKTAINEMTNA